jgi:sirohydrochlorin ferrochelatase
MLPAYLLISHGSRDFRHQIALARLAELVQKHLEQKLLSQNKNYQKKEAQLYATQSKQLLIKPILPLVKTASLELASMPLHERITEIAHQATETGLKQLVILPLFLLDGVHIQEDIPIQVNLAQKAIAGKIAVNLLPHLGSFGTMYHLLAEQFTQLEAEGRILLAHGSRHQKAHQHLENWATELNAVAAYWSISPSLNEQVQSLIQAGKQKIAIVPYFLFAGSLTEAIANQVQQLQQQLPMIQLDLGQPLGATTALANLIAEQLIH